MDEEDIEKMRQELKQKSQSIINLEKKQESLMPCRYIEESQHLKIESKNEIDFRNCIRVSVHEFLVGDIVDSTVEKKEDAKLNITVDSMLDEVNRIMCGFDDHVFLNNHCDDENSQFIKTFKDISNEIYDIVSKKTIDSNKVNDNSINNVIKNKNNEYKFRKQKMCSPIIEIKDNDEAGNQKVSQSVHLHPVFDSCSYIDYDMKTEVIDWCNILDKDSYSEKIFTSA
ncbi:uncharacterized protein LOC136075119 isoform X2 [Hydra vulgaris]